MRRNLLFRLLGIHTCNDCYRKDLTAASWIAQKGTGFDTTPESITAATCDNQIVDLSALRVCRNFRDKYG